MPYQREQKGSHWNNGFAIEFAFQRRRIISQIYIRAASPGAFAFLVWSVEDNPVLPAALENAQKPRLVPSQRALHTALKISPLSWEVNGYLWDCRLYKAKHTVTVREVEQRGLSLFETRQPMSPDYFCFHLSINMFWLSILRNISTFLPCCPIMCSRLTNTHNWLY